MTLWQAIKGLASLPAALHDLRALQQVGTVRVASLTENDVIVVDCDAALTHQGRENVARMVKSVWPDNRVMVWDSGLRMSVVRDDRLSRAKAAS